MAQKLNQISKISNFLEFDSRHNFYKAPEHVQFFDEILEHHLQVEQHVNDCNGEGGEIVNHH